jgi:tRNA(fMet)-specific endonuclease VapC
MRYMLDTNTCSYVLRSRPASVKQRFDEVGPDALSVSALVLAELLFGAARHPSGAVIRREIRDFVSRLTVLPWDEAAAEHYGDIRTGIETCGKPLGAMDLMIAAHARSRGATLVSSDVRHFRRVEGLLVANWV